MPCLGYCHLSGKLLSVRQMVRLMRDVAGSQQYPVTKVCTSVFFSV
jgi:hypothetical protein